MRSCRSTTTSCSAPSMTSVSSRRGEQVASPSRSTPYRASGRSRRTRYAPSYWLCLLANSSLTARSGKLMIKIEADEGISLYLGNYQILARCTYEHLARQQTQLSVTDLREQETVRIALTKAPQPYWELSFVNEEG